MRVYVEVARRSFRRQSTYRAALAAGAFTNGVFGFIRANVLRAVIGTSTLGGLQRDSATAFTFVSQALIATTLLFGDFAFAAQVRTGEVAVDLVRPWDWSTFRLASDLGRSAFSTISRGLVIALAGWLAYRYPVPALPRLAGFVLVVVAAAALASRLWTIAGLVGFWVVDASGVVQLAVVGASLCSGLLLPLSLYPDGLAHVLRLLPFAGLVQGPTEVFLGTGEVWGVLAHQLAWIAVLEGVLRVELKAAMRKLEVQGG